MKKFLALMALLLCFMVLFVACNKNTDEPKPTEKPTETPTEAPAGCEHVYDNDCDADCNLCEEERSVAHVEETLEGVAATCTTTGLTAGKKCSVCDAVVEAQEEIPATGHTEKALDAVAATCTETGLTAGKKCSVCDAVIEAQKEVPATGHTEETIPAVAATCTETGLTAGKKCSVCDAVIEAQKEVAKADHTVVEFGKLDATCTTPGYESGTKCSVCDQVLTAKKETPAKGHKEETIPAVAATCTKTGLTEGKKCSVCDVVTKAQEKTPTVAHTEKVVAGYAATCTEAGLTDGVVCGVCDAEITAQEEIPAEHVNVVNIKAIAPKCDEVGYTSGKKCDTCGEVIEEPTEVPMIDHTYDYDCDEFCRACGEYNYEVVDHEWALSDSGAIVCTYGCENSLAPVTYTSGEDIYYRAFDLQINVSTVTWSTNDGSVTYNSDGYVTVSGMTANADPGLDKVLSIAQGGAYEVGNLPVIQRYLVMRYRTDTASSQIRFVTWGDPALVDYWGGTNGEWQTVVVDMKVACTVGFRVDIRCNIGANTTDFSHFASFETLEEANAYATQFSYIVDEKCPHVEYMANWNNEVVCTSCYETAAPTTSHVGSDIYDIVDPDSADFGLVTDNDEMGVTVTGTSEHAYGVGASLKLVNGTDFGRFMVVVYKMDVAENTFLGVSVGDNIASYVQVVQIADKFTTCNYGGTNSSGNALELVCNFGGLSNSTSIYAIYTFDSVAVANAYAEMLTGICYHDATEVNEAGHTVCTYCEMVYGTAEWPFDLTLGENMTPEFVAGTSMMDPGVQEWHYTCVMENDGLIKLQAGENVSILVNGCYATAPVAVSADDVVEIVVFAEWEEDTWELITDGVYFKVEFVPALEFGWTKTPDFVEGTSLADPGILEWHYGCVIENDGLIMLQAGENVSILVNGTPVTAPVEVSVGDVVELVAYAERDEETFELITDGVSFVVELALPGSQNNPFDLELGEITTPEFSEGTSMADPGVQEYYYQWTATGNGTITLSEAENIMWTVNGGWTDGYSAEVVKGDVIDIVVYMLRDDEWNAITDPFTFSVEFVAHYELNEDGSIVCNKDCHEFSAPASYVAGVALDTNKFAGGAPWTTATDYSYDAEGGYVRVTGISATADTDPSADLAYGVFTTSSRYLVIRFRTNEVGVHLRVITTASAWGVTDNLYVSTCTEANQWQVAVIDTKQDQIAELVSLRCNVGATSASTSTDISHIISFATLEEANAYANAFGIGVDGLCGHNGYTTTETTPATCTTPGEALLECATCGLSASIPTGLGSHDMAPNETDETVLECTVCGLLITPKTFQSDSNLFGAVTAGDAVDAGDEGITITGVGTGCVFAANDTARVQLQSEAGYGQYLVVVYKSTYTTGYLAIGSSDNSGTGNYAAGINATESYKAYLYGGTTGATGEANETLDLLFHFACAAEDTTNVLAVITFDTAEEAQAYTDYLNATLAAA